MGEEQGGELSVAEARQALERFVVDNDDLLALEERIGRFNIFDALGIARAEIRHSNFLAWLLDPAESHGQGSLFLKAILMDLLKQSPTELRPLSPIGPDEAELRGVEIRREWRNTDLLIKLEEPKIVVIIENKVDADLYNDLSRYEKSVTDEFPGHPQLRVVLSRRRVRLANARWMAYRYSDIHRVLSECARVAAPQMNPDAFAFLSHYLRLVGSRFMDDPQIDRLCREIYSKHHVALDLIIERVASGHRLVMPLVRQLLGEQHERWEVTKRYSEVGRSVDFMPAMWQDVLPTIGNWSRFNRHIWLTLGFSWRSTRLTFWAGAWSTDDQAVRDTVIARLTRDPVEFGFRCGKASDKWVSLAQRNLLNWEEGDSPEASDVIEVVRRTLDEWHENLAGTTDALRPIFDEWKRSSSAVQG